MQSIGGMLSSNQIVVALANLGGVIGLLILVVAALKKAQQFARSAWEGSIKSALTLMRFRLAKRVIWCARDLHIFVVEIMHRLLASALGILSPIMLMLSYTSPEAAQYRMLGIPKNWQAANDRVLMIAGLVYLILAVLAIAGLGRFMSKVRRYRMRMIRRGLD